MNVSEREVRTMSLPVHDGPSWTNREGNVTSGKVGRRKSRQDCSRWRSLQRPSSHRRLLLFLLPGRRELKIKIAFAADIAASVLVVRVHLSAKATAAAVSARIDPIKQITVYYACIRNLLK